ncbi:MAG: collagen binding domain-containing protein, partial [Pirellula sp.]
MSKNNFRAALLASLSFLYITDSYAVVCAQESETKAETLSQPAQSTTASESKSDGLNHHQWLRLSADGSFWGTLGTPAGESQIKQSGVDVALVHNGKSVAVVTTAEDGSFRFTDIKPGVYALVAQNPSTLAVMSLTLLDSSAGKHLPGGIQVRTLTPATERVVSLVRSGSIPRLSNSHDVERDPVGADRTFLNSGRIAIDAEGGIRGRVSVPDASLDLSSTSIYLTHSGNEVARTRADRQGNYRFDNIPPGNYGFVASGPAGIAALGFVAVGSGGAGGDSSTSISNDGRKFVLAPLQQDSVAALNVELASCDCLGVPALAQSELPMEEACCPLPMAGCCGAAGVGYGGGGGG